MFATVERSTHQFAYTLRLMSRKFRLDAQYGFNDTKAAGFAEPCGFILISQRRRISLERQRDQSYANRPCLRNKHGRERRV